MVGYSWTWDLGGSDMSTTEYRTMLLKLGSLHEFSEFKTNDPNVLLRPENLFMARIGGKVPGSMPYDSRSIWEEGLRIPPVKIDLIMKGR